MPTPRESATGDSPASLESLQPRVRWRQITDAPLGGLALAREAGRILTWDDAHNLSVTDLIGNRVATTRIPLPLLLAAISDDGKQIVVSTKEGEIWWLNQQLEPRIHRAGLRHLIGLAITPQGEYLAASLNDNHTRIFDWHGRPVTDLVTHRPLRFMAFLAGQPYLVGAAEYGLAGCYDLDGTPRWQDSLWSSAGHLSASGKGFAILVSCFGHGLQRYGLDGTNEGAYHLGGGVARASIDYDGKLIAAATLEGELIVLNTAGHVLWRQMLPKPAKDVALDAAGQLLVYGQETGEYTVLELVPCAASTAAGKPESPDRPAGHRPEPSAPIVLRPATAAARDAPAAAGPGSARQLREPTWKVKAFDNPSQAETAVLALLDEPVRVAAFSSRKKMEVYDERGARIHATDPMSGVGRYLESEAGVVIAATDREVAVYDVTANRSSRFDKRFVQISHLRMDAAAGELVIVEERDRLSRYDLRGRRRWENVIDSPIEGLALGADRLIAVTTESGQLIVVDGNGRNAGEFRVAQREPLALVRLGSLWITLAGKSQKVRGHEVGGAVQWETTLPTEAWRLSRLGNRVVSRAAGGRSYVLDVAGRLLLDTTELPHEAMLFEDRSGEPLALFWRVGNLMITDLVGRVRWRHLSAEPPGPVAAGAAGVACTLGHELAFFAD